MLTLTGSVIAYTWSEVVAGVYLLNNDLVLV
jgi:hypothetical protein